MNDHFILRGCSTVYGVAWLVDYSHEEFHDQGLFPDQPAWLLEKIFVDRQKRGRHYGSMLLDKVCRQADSESVTLYLQVDPDYDSPLDESETYAFYMRHGFKSYLQAHPKLMKRSPERKSTREEATASDSRNRAGADEHDGSVQLMRLDNGEAQDPEAARL